MNTQTHTLPRTSRAGTRNVGPKQHLFYLDSAVTATRKHSRSRRTAVGEAFAVSRRRRTPLRPLKKMPWIHMNAPWGGRKKSPISWFPGVRRTQRKVGWAPNNKTLSAARSQSFCASLAFIFLGGRGSQDPERSQRILRYSDTIFVRRHDMYVCIEVDIYLSMCKVNTSVYNILWTDVAREHVSLFKIIQILIVTRTWYQVQFFICIYMCMVWNGKERYAFNIDRRQTD